MNLIQPITKPRKAALLVMSACAVEKLRKKG